ncbi:MAG: alpha-glucan family phosphorylase [Dehalococcoidia bacterium]|nr:alpha-glucan family phosphorylase [Dehalococcoidia bacterium]
MRPDDFVPDGSRDIETAVRLLAGHLAPGLEPLARLAYNYRWSWDPAAEALFRRIDPEHWLRCGENPVRLLQEVDPALTSALAADPGFLFDMHARALDLDAMLRDAPTAPPVAYLCAEFGIHQSLPFYAGGLGILAGDMLKQASDDRVPVVGVGLFYSQGSFHQRLDLSGYQHEYWLRTESDRLPAVPVTGPGGQLRITVDLRGQPVAARIWRVDAGVSRLYLLDTNLPENRITDRWITSRLYVGDRGMRLAQYAVLGIGGIRALRAMGIPFRAVHLNEGHAALAILERLREELPHHASAASRIGAVRASTAFTTHTPVLAGNETFDPATVRELLPRLAEDAGLSWDELLALARVDPVDTGAGFGLTPLALHGSGAANGVSRLHGEVARRMWHGIWPDRPEAAVPIAHVTNGVHQPTWMAPRWAELLDRYVPGWRTAPPGDPTWSCVDAIPDAEIWALRCELRAGLAALVRTRSVIERLGRGESVEYANSAVDSWRDDALTIGFARRIATYKRLYLVTSRPDLALEILRGDRPVQIAIAGRAHPNDEEAKHTLQSLFALNDAPGVGGRAVVFEEYDMSLARQLVQGCDLWLNLPRRPYEASGTSGMKSAANGGLQLSVLDGWWAEGYAPAYGWAIPSDSSLPEPEQDARDGLALFTLLRDQVIPLFYDRYAADIPREWVRRIKRSLAALLPQYSARRMLRDYQERAWPPQRDM